MLSFKRFVNGIEVDEVDLRNIAFESDVIDRIIHDVNKRLKEQAEAKNSEAEVPVIAQSESRGAEVLKDALSRQDTNIEVVVDNS